MPSSSPHIQQVRVKSQTLPVRERVEQTSARGDIKVSPCGGISITVSLDRPNEEVTISANDPRDNNADFVYKKEGGTYDKTTTYGPFPEGEEVFYVKENNKGCTFKVTKEIIHCDISISSTVTDEEYGQGDGEIEATTSTPSDSVEWSFDGGAWFSGSKTQKWTGLSAGTYIVESRDEWGCKASKSITVNNIADTNPPTVPQNLTATDVGSEIDLGWDESSDSETSVSHYRLYRSTQSGFIADSSTLVGDNITGTSYTDSGLGTDTYYYKVSAVDDAGNESNSSTEASVAFDSPNTAPTWDDKQDLFADSQPKWENRDNLIHTVSSNTAPTWDDKQDLFADSQPKWENRDNLIHTNEGPNWTATDDYTYSK